KTAGETGSILCIHNQETAAEDEMFIQGRGELIEKLEKMTGAYSNWKTTGKSSLKFIMGILGSTKALQLVHNTFSNTQDIRTANQIHPSLFWCLCVNANIFIENSLP